jgi:hypothetical protein
MKLQLLKYPALFSLLLCAVSLVPPSATAQDDAGAGGPPKVLVIQREYTKPGRGGMVHEKTESAFGAAIKANHSTMRYLAMTSLTGADRALFFEGYPSLEAWETENKSEDQNATLSASVDRAAVADGDLLSSTDSSVWLRQDEMSMHPGSIVGARYMEITVYQIKPGHEAEWAALVKLVKEGYAKGIPAASWTMFRELFGSPGGSYIVLQPLKSLAEEDHHLAGGEQFVAAMGAEGMKKLDQMEASCVESEQTNLFHFSPKMSVPPEAWIEAEPDYWKPKTAATARKTQAKPQQ